MTEFHVEYSIEVEAETHEAAVRKVAEMLAAGGAARGEYKVSVHSDVQQHPVESVDLGEIDGTWDDGPVDEPQVAGSLVWHVLRGPDSEGGIWLQQGPKSDDEETPEGFELVAYLRPVTGETDFITAASAREAEAIYRAWLDREGIEIPDGS